MLLAPWWVSPRIEIQAMVDGFAVWQRQGVEIGDLGPRRRAHQSRRLIPEDDAADAVQLVRAAAIGRAVDAARRASPRLRR